MNSMIYKIGFFLVFISSVALAMNNDFKITSFIRSMERCGECMILLDGTVLEYPTGKKVGKIEDGRFIAVYFRENEKEFSQRNAKKE